MSDKVNQQIDGFLAELDAAGIGGYRAVLHGSAARGQHIPGWSDINIVLILNEITTEVLGRLRGPLNRWREATGALPLMLTHREWLRSADAYPLEISEMRNGYRVLRGEDPVAELTVSPVDLRTALERELRGKLLRLRQGYALLSDDPKRMGEFVRRSISAVLFLCRGLLDLAGKLPPDDPVDLANAAGRVAGFDGPTLARIVTRRGLQDWECTEADVRGYLAAVEQAARYVDHFQTGERA
jgi:predicted nucleotidyltransferase